MKNIHIRKISLAAATAVIFASGCFKSVTTDTVVVLKTCVQDSSGGAIHPSEKVLAYGYYGTDTCWTVASYRDARDMCIRNKQTGDLRSIPDTRGYSHLSDTLEGTYTNLDIDQRFAMIVVVDTTRLTYAYSFKEMNAVNLEETYLTVVFYNWKTTAYTEGSAGSTDPRTEGTNGKCYWHLFPPLKDSLKND